ncbi:MAG: mechanosensitive ion channel domain-containing protein, partial [Bacteroidota bacterium]
TTLTAQVTAWIIDHAPPFLLAVVLLIIGLKVIRQIRRSAEKAMLRAQINEDIVPFLAALVGIGLQILLFLSVAGIVGIDTASFVAVLAAAGFAVGLALQGSLSNFAAGIIILLFRPYRVGQWVEVAEKFGKVSKIQVFNTIMITPGNKTLIIPNGQIIDNIVTNFSAQGSVRLELQISMPYKEDFPKVESIIMNVMREMPAVLPEPAPSVGIETFDSHSIVLAMRPYVDPEDYWPVTYELNQRVKAAFSQYGIQVAYSEGIELGEIGQ